jgi:hypothetical protein
MYHRHERRGKFQQWLGIIVLLAAVLFASAIPGHTRSGGGHGGGRGFHGGHRGGRGFHGGHGFHSGHGWRGHGFYGKHWRGGVGVTIGVGPYGWPYGWPYSYPYAYPYVYPYTYSPPIYVQPSQPLSIQPPASPPVWYYCENPQGYYPYVEQCPGGWRTVAPSPP